jgi:hypothetical protein
MPVAAILGAADINNTCSYYHCSDGSKCARGYHDLPSYYYYGFFVVVIFFGQVNLPGEARNPSGYWLLLQDQ